MAHELPPLPYDHAALEPHIDAQTMQIHHGKHHQTYVTNLNNALQNHPDLQSKSVEDLCRAISTVPEAIRTAVRNNGGGHWNHSMFWKWMAPNAGGAPTGKVADGINAAFGSFDAIKEQWAKAGAGRFGQVNFGDIDVHYDKGSGVLRVRDASTPGNDWIRVATIAGAPDLGMAHFLTMPEAAVSTDAWFEGLFQAAGASADLFGA